MGQRHQAYIIARVVPFGGQQALYRCIGALHHQWCFGSLPLTAARRFINLVKQPENLDVSREEIRTLDGLYGRWGEEPEIVNVPCPFTQFLLASAWGVDLSDPQDPYSSSVINLPAGMEPREGDNNDGITVIDITDPENPTYCFVLNIYESDMDPISAREYALSYYPDHHPQSVDEPNPDLRAQYLESVIVALENVPVMSKDAIIEAWLTSQRESAARLVNEAIPLELQRGKVPSLFELALVPAVEQAIANNNIDTLDFLLLDSTKVSILKDILRSKNPVTDGAFSILQKILLIQKEQNLDLSGFRLSGKQIIDLLSSLGEGSNPGITALDLSHNNKINVGDLEQILLETPGSLRRLVIWGLTIADAEIITLMDTKPKIFYHLESIAHPAFMKGQGQKSPKFSPAFTHIFSEGRTPLGISFPYFTPSTLAQGLIDYLGPASMSQPMYYPLDTTLTIMAAYSTTSRLSGSWGERCVTCVPSYSDATHIGRGEWLFFLALEGPMYRNLNAHTPCFFAFMRANKQGLEYLSNSAGTGSIPLKPQFVDIFDARDFFKELELEGRPSPDPKALEQLFALLAGNPEAKRNFCLLTHDKMAEISKSRS